MNHRKFLIGLEIMQAGGSIDDETFVQGLEFLIKQGLLQIKN
jgi:hypothetical protein